MSIFKYGNMWPVRSVEVNEGERKEYNNRTPERAIAEKMKVLRGFCIVDDDNEVAMKARLEKAVAESPCKDFDRVLDGIARKLISEKLGD